MTDFVTVLTCAPGKRAAKAYARLDAAPDDYDAGFEFGVYELPLFELAELAELLRDLEGESSRMIIRGRAHADIARDGSELVPRRCTAKPDLPPPAFAAAEHHWLAVDVDTTDTPADGCSRAAVEAWRATLPPGMRTAALVWQWSAKAHLSATVRGRAWLWCDAPVSDGRARLLALDIGTDRALYNPVQPHYTAAPVMPAGVDDPIPERVLWFDGGDAVLPEPRERVRETKALHSHESEGVLSANAPDVSAIVAAVGPADDYAGERWFMLGAIAGHMRRAGLSRAHGEAFVRTWLADASPSPTDRGRGLVRPDVKVALERMLPAWDIDADLVSGAAAFDDAALSERVWAACKPASAEGARMRLRPEVLAARGPAGTVAGKHAPDPSDLGRDWAPLDGPVRELRYLCRGLGLAYVGKCAAVHGFAGAGKGPLLTLIALAVASGKPVLGHAVERAPVLYLDAETGELAEIRAQRIARAMGVDVEALRREGWLRVVHVDRSLEDLLPAIELAAESMSAGLICCDSYSSLVAGEENSSEYADPLWELGRLGQRIGAVPLVTMHERKAQQGARTGALESISGTNRLAAALATSIRLTPSPTEPTRITVACTRAPEKRFEPIELTWTDGAQGALAAGFQAAVIVPASEAARERKRADAESRLDDWVASADRFLADAGVRPLTAGAIAREVGVSGQNTARLVDALIARRIARREFGAKNAAVYVWVPPEHRRAYEGAGPRSFPRGR